MKPFLFGVVLGPFVLAAIVAALLMSGCSRSQSWDQQIIGTWRATLEKDKGVIFVYRNDGTFEMRQKSMSFKGRWLVVDKEKRTMKAWSDAFETVNESTAPIYEVTIDGDSMKERDIKNNSVSDFVRVPDNENP